MQAEIASYPRFRGKTGAIQSLDASLNQTGKTQALLDSMEARQ